MTPEWELRARYRVAALRDLAGVMAEDVRAWFAAREADERFRRFQGHFTVLRGVLGQLLHDVDAAAAAIPHTEGSGRIYEVCQDLERSLLVVRRLFDWYAGKYDQRLDPDLGVVLSAADELVRSCWTEPFVALGRRPPTGPLPYVDVRFDAYATVRESVPADLRAPADALVADFVRELPVPAVALPVSARRGAWWLGLVAHEVGHHVQWDADPMLRAATRAAVAASVTDDDLAGSWAGWSTEVFADAYAVMMVGPEAAWALDELQHGDVDTVIDPSAGGTHYPPPAVRLALIGEVARLVWPGQDWPPAAHEVLAWLNRSGPPATSTLVRRHLAEVPAVAKALAQLPFGSTTLRGAADPRPEWYAPGGRVETWACRLQRPAPVFTGSATRNAARAAVAAGLRAHRTLQVTAPFDADRLRLLHTNLAALLASCGDPGVLAAAPAPDTAELVARLSRRLLERQ